MKVKIVMISIALVVLSSCSNHLLSNISDSNTEQSRSITFPETPVNLKTMIKRPSALGLEWDSVENSIGYKVYYISKIVDSAKQHIIGSNTNYINIKGLRYGDIYDIYVTSVDLSGNESLPSKVLTVHMDCKLKKPSGLAEIATTTDTIRLKWAVNGDPVGKYYVHLESSGHTKTVSVYTNYIEVNELQEGTEYYIFIESCSDDIYRSEYSDGIIVKTHSLYDTWSRDTVYIRGDKVRYNGIVYVAKWWSYNDIPGSVQYGPWESEK